VAVRSRALLEAIIESAPIALIVSDAQGTLRLVNHAAEVLFGYARNELVGHPIEMLLPVAMRERHPAVRDTFMRNPSPRQMGIGRDLAAVRKDECLQAQAHTEERHLTVECRDEIEEVR